MKPIGFYDANSILSKDLVEEIFLEADDINRAYMIAQCSARAKELKVGKQFDKLISDRAKVDREIIKSMKQPDGKTRYTNFLIPEDSGFNNMKCGSWFADDNGVYCLNVMGMEQRACHHPILPVKRLSNVETGEEKIEITFYRNHRWRHISVDKDIVSSANKIVGLSKLGIAVTSENAKYLVKYLSDVENFNEDEIDVQRSTTKIGWFEGEFIPYDTDIIFDGDIKFRQLYESISHPAGEFGTWLEHMLKLRKSHRYEILFNLSASFASVLVKPLGILPFFVDLWGETEGGKTVCLMVGASVWGNPDANNYIGDYKSTDVALEVRADMLNSLPVMLDDTSNATNKIRDDMENIIYRFCSGKGKSRSNKDLGQSRENTWKCCFITNGERPLSGYVTQGGAMNRIIEVPCGNNIFEDPSETAEILKANYGHAGKLFIDTIKTYDKENRLKNEYNKIVKEISRDNKMQKQAMSLACILLADRLIDDFIFHDGQRLTVEEATKCLIDRNELSENERCYKYLVDMVRMNPGRFSEDANGIEKWGIIRKEFVCWYPTAFHDTCENKGFSTKSFLSWANANGIVEKGSDRASKLVKVDGRPVRMIKMLIDDKDEDQFVDIDDSDKEIVEQFKR